MTKDDLPYIISDVLNSGDFQQKVFVKSYVLTHSKGLQPSTTVAVEIDGELHEAHAQGDGQYDAFCKRFEKSVQDQGNEFP